jgi:hypothetical protein
MILLHHPVMHRLTAIRNVLTSFFSGKAAGYRFGSPIKRFLSVLLKTSIKMP